MSDVQVASTGVSGLDEVLGGGFPPHRIYLIQGDPGVGKTTLALQYLLKGRELGEKTLYVTLSETREEIEAVARSHGWGLDGIEIHEMAEGGAGPEIVEDDNTLYLPSEVELGERMRSLLTTVDRVKPRRVVVDSCSELRLLAQTPLRFRRQIIALKQGLVDRRCTILLLENTLVKGGDVLLQSLVHGVVDMEQLSPLYGAERRRLRVTKLREVKFRGGYHDMNIEKDGIVVFPRLVASEHHTEFRAEMLSSGIASLDSLVGGGLDRGTSSLFMGPAGSGKSALASRYVHAALQRGESAAFFAFDESVSTLFSRSAALGMDLRPHVASRKLLVQQVDPAELSPGELVHRVRVAVEQGKSSVVVIDSLNGYLHSMPEEQFVVTQMHELLSYLRQQGVVTILVMVQNGILGEGMSSPVDVSYLADTVVLFRFFEAEGRVRKAISVMKKRTGGHEDTIREFSLSSAGLSVGAPLRDLHGVLRGTPSIQQGSAGSMDASRA
jgi:circadian clock protein KaiC